MVSEVITMHIIDKSFTRAPKSYIVQSLLAVVTVAIILYFVKVITDGNEYIRKVIVTE